ncbi:MAG TPA: YdeI/OmpD-associated family protein [Candidatus Acidoferrales bacterium]|nr:YdeI/OmpD-associated family protein [Candidatus Acidoferrales bacterium]
MSQVRQRALDDPILDVYRAHGRRRAIFLQFVSKRVVGFSKSLWRLRVHAPFLRLPLTRSQMKTLLAKDRRRWRAWLRKNHSKRSEIWLVYYKKDSGKPRIPYEDAVEEALCFGWIDGKTQRIDDERYAQRFTPRRPRSSWNRANIERAERLIADGKMAAAGLTAFHSDQRHDTPVMPAEMPGELEAKFRKHSTAWRNFKNFPPYYRRMTSGWVASAKKEATRLARLSKLIEFSARNKRIKYM